MIRYIHGCHFKLDLEKLPFKSLSTCGLCFPILWNWTRLNVLFRSLQARTSCHHHVGARLEKSTPSSVNHNRKIASIPRSNASLLTSSRRLISNSKPVSIVLNNGRTVCVPFPGPSVKSTTAAPYVTSSWSRNIRMRSLRVDT